MSKDTATATPSTPPNAVLDGQFTESITLDCPSCECGDWDDDCTICHGSGDYVREVPISASTANKIINSARND